MALIDEVTAYYTTQRLVEWTNPDDRSASTIHPTNLQDACDDTEAWFETFAGTVYDNTNRKHLLLARKGVKLQLYERASKGGQKHDDDMREWETSVMKLAETDARNRILPSTDGYSEVTDDDNAKKPFFDRSKFRGIRPR